MDSSASRKLYECAIIDIRLHTSMQDTWGENIQKPHFATSSFKTIYEQEITEEKKLF